ncbi:hypothetical protein VNO77_39272 [Canavalia gladiata]|uniref:UBA domain-containing protein n=1 Tax=Canavalia gladiata TaxID=3824 RepID=A0AAN9KC96_CANGL
MRHSSSLWVMAIRASPMVVGVSTIGCFSSQKTKRLCCVVHRTNIASNRMSPSMKSKSKSQEKASARAGKEQQKASPKTSGSPNHGSGIPVSAHSPMLGMFQTPETSLVASSTRVHDNSHFPKVDDADEHSSSPQGTVSECDSVSNNGSCSGESEESKEKATNSSMRLDVIPGCDNDRREKIRLKNERKHQRQRERRAQELHDRCCGYLMSKKLEALAQQLVAMGFSSERATLALMLNDGKVEESVSWLFEGSQDESRSKDTTSNLLSEGNLKIDISDELAQITALEAKYTCSKQEVERVVVACEGNLQKAENALKSQKQESPVTQSKSEDSAQNNSLMRSQGLPAALVSMQQRESERDFNYYKVGGADSMFLDLESRNVQSLHLNHPNVVTEKRWGVPGSSPSSAMLAMAPSAQALSPFVKMEGRPSGLMNEGRMIQQGLGREPAMMQHPQFTNAKQNPLASINSFPSGTTGWYVNSVPPVENMRSNGKLLQTQNIRSMSPNQLEQFCQAPYKEYSHFLGPVDSSGVGGFYNKPMGASSSSSLSSSSSPSPTIPSQHHGSWSANASSSPALTVPPSLGLFSGHQNTARTFGSHSHVDWNNGGLMPEFDYSSIDWSLNPPSSSGSGGLWLGISSLLRNSYGNRRSNSCINGLQNVGMARETSSSSAGLREWTTPFAGKDIFSVPRQFVTSPPL